MAAFGVRPLVLIIVGLFVVSGCAGTRDPGSFMSLAQVDSLLKRAKGGDSAALRTLRREANAGDARAQYGFGRAHAEAVTGAEDFDRSGALVDDVVGRG